MLDALLNVATKSRLLDFVRLKGYKLKIATQWPPFDREVDFDVYFYTSKDGGSSSFTKTNFFKLTYKSQFVVDARGAPLQVCAFILGVCSHSVCTSNYDLSGSLNSEMLRLFVILSEAKFWERNEM